MHKVFYLVETHSRHLGNIQLSINKFNCELTVFPLIVIGLHPGLCSVRETKMFGPPEPQ